MKRAIIFNKGEQNRNNITNYNNIQFQNKKNTILTKIKKEHSINFKKKDNLNNSNISRIYPIKNKKNKIINYIEYNIQKSSKSNNFCYDKNKIDLKNQIDFCKTKRNNALTPTHRNKNYNNMKDIYNLNKSKISFENKYSKTSIKYIQKEFINDEKSPLNSENNIKNNNLVFNQNFIGIKNSKYKKISFINDDIYKYYKKSENKGDNQEISSDESIMNE